MSANDVKSSVCVQFTLSTYTLWSCAHYWSVDATVACSSMPLQAFNRQKHVEQINICKENKSVKQKCLLICHMKSKFRPMCDTVQIILANVNEKLYS